MNFNQRVEEFLVNILVDGRTKSIVKQLEVWLSPPTEWSKVNIDVAYKEGKAALSLVKRNDAWEITKIASLVTVVQSALESKWSTLEWASDLAREHEWNQVIWSSDARAVVDGLANDLEPLGWGTRYAILKIRENFQLQDWKLVWNARSSNLLAYSVAKFSLKCNRSLVFDLSNLTCLPNDLMKLAHLDWE